MLDVHCSDAMLQAVYTRHFIVCIPSSVLLGGGLVGMLVGRI
jgi:hypothetical protein